MTPSQLCQARRAMICTLHRSLKISLTFALGVLTLAACGDTDSGVEPGNQVDASGVEDAGWPGPDSSMDVATPDATPDATTDAPMPPNPRAPCELGSCWENAPALSGACGNRTVNENFETELYNSHRVPLAAPANVSVELTLDVTGGSWNPALLVLATDGTTLYDGERGLVGGTIQIDPLASGRGTSSASVRITAQTDTPLHVFVTSWEVIDSGFASPMPSDASYTLVAFADCPLPDAVCPMDPGSITGFGSGYFTASDSDDPSSPNYSPYKRDSRTEHSGYDINAPLGTPVVATQSGTIVSVSTTDDSDCGLSINLSADSGVTFRHCHLESVVVTSGHVEVGQLIGHNGDTGNAHSPHVHFVYLDAPDITGSGTTDQKSEKVNAYVDSLCQ